MTKKEFKQNAEEAIGNDIYFLSDKELDILTEALYEPEGKKWTYKDFSELARTVQDCEGELYTILNNYNISWSIRDPSNMELLAEWFDDHPQVLLDVTNYIITHQKKGGN